MANELTEREDVRELVRQRYGAAAGRPHTKGGATFILTVMSSVSYKAARSFNAVISDSYAHYMQSARVIITPASGWIGMLPPVGSWDATGYRRSRIVEKLGQAKLRHGSHP